MSLAATAEGLPTLTYTPAQTVDVNHILGPRPVPLCILPVGHPTERPDQGLRAKKPLGEVSRFATTFTPYVSREPSEPPRALEPGVTMAEDSTRRLLKVFGIAVTTLEDALDAGLADGAKKAEAELRERMKEVTALVERLSERAAKL